MYKLNDSMNTAKKELDAIRNAEGKMNPTTHRRLVRFAEARYNAIVAEILKRY